MSHLHQYLTLAEIEPIQTAVGSSELGDGDTRTDNALQLELDRLHADCYDEGAFKATAALFAGLLMGSGSTALIIWLVTLAF